MKRIFCFLLCSFLSLVAVTLQAQKLKLRFDEEGSFKVMQVTDTHLSKASKGAEETKHLIEELTQIEKPQLAVLTGDIVTAEEATETWLSLIKLFEELKLPFVVTLGNHDTHHITKDEIYDLLLRSPYYVGTRGKKELTGRGNCVLPIYAPEGKKARALIYCFDSNIYAKGKENGLFDWIHSDQIAWYRQQSESFTKSNRLRQPLPSLAFFHIPFPEYVALKENGNYLGHCEEGLNASPKLNSGLFTSFVEMGDVMGVFVGHEHSNDLLGLYQGLALGYGRITGAEAHSSLVRGCRFIELKGYVPRQGHCLFASRPPRYAVERSFTSWIRTLREREETFFYPSGITSVDIKTGIYEPALKLKTSSLAQGLKTSFYKQKFTKVIELEEAKPQRIFVSEHCTIKGITETKNFGLKFEGFVRVPELAVYRFDVYADDGAMLFIDGQLVVNNDKGALPGGASGKIALEQGFHRIKVLYRQGKYGQDLDVRVSSINLKKQSIPNTWLYHKD